MQQDTDGVQRGIRLAVSETLQSSRKNGPLTKMMICFTSFAYRVPQLHEFYALRCMPDYLHGHRIETLEDTIEGAEISNDVLGHAHAEGKIIAEEELRALRNEVEGLRLVVEVLPDDLFYDAKLLQHASERLWCGHGQRGKAVNTRKSGLSHYANVAEGRWQTCEIMSSTLHEQHRLKVVVGRTLCVCATSESTKGSLRQCWVLRLS